MSTPESPAPFAVTRADALAALAAARGEIVQLPLPVLRQLTVADLATLPDAETMTLSPLTPEGEGTPFELYPSDRPGYPLMVEVVELANRKYWPDPIDPMDFYAAVQRAADARAATEGDVKPGLLEDDAGIIRYSLTLYVATDNLGEAAEAARARWTALTAEAERLSQAVTAATGFEPAVAPHADLDPGALYATEEPEGVDLPDLDRMGVDDIRPGELLMISLSEAEGLPYPPDLYLSRLRRPAGRTKAGAAPALPAGARLRIDVDFSVPKKRWGGTPTASAYFQTFLEAVRERRPTEPRLLGARLEDAQPHVEFSVAVAHAGPNLGDAVRDALALVRDLARTPDAVAARTHAAVAARVQGEPHDQREQH